MYLLRTRLGWKAQERLWQYIDKGGVAIHNLTAAETRRMRALMEKYRDLPMDFADASLVAVAESSGTRRVFTIDSDFRIYRLNDRDSFEVVP